MSFDFIYGDDEYLTEQAARERWATLSQGVDAEFGMEIIDGRCLKVDEVDAMAVRLRGAVQTMGLFGGARAVWLKGVNFVSDTVVGRSEGTATILEDLKPILENANPEEVKILISATPVDRRLSFFKWLSSKGEAKEIKSLAGMEADGLQKLGKEKGLLFDTNAAELFLKKVGTSARGVDSELEKLATYLDTSAAKPQTVSEELVLEITSTVAAGEFFEPLEAFYSRKPSWALPAIRSYFANKDNDARPILAAFFNRNRLLMMIKAAEAEGLAKFGFKGINWSPRANELKAKMGSEKTPFNIFAQNPWYLGKLAQEAAKFTLDELKNIQEDLINTFEKIHRMEESTALEGLFVKYVAAKK